MKNLFVPYNLAVLAKEKGFNIPVLACYDGRKESNPLVQLDNSLHGIDYNKWDNLATSAPLYQQLIDWFFNNHKIIVRRTFTDYEIIQEGKQILFAKDLDKALEESFKLIYMSYNITSWKTKKLDDLIVPLKAFYESKNDNWHPSLPEIINADGDVELSCGCEQTIKGKLKDGMLIITEFEMTGEGSGRFKDFILKILRRH